MYMALFSKYPVVNFMEFDVLDRGREADCIHSLSLWPYYRAIFMLYRANVDLAHGAFMFIIIDIA